jgi:hypothetical protein
VFDVFDLFDVFNVHSLSLMCEIDEYGCVILNRALSHFDLIFGAEREKKVLVACVCVCSYF